MFNTAQVSFYLWGGGGICSTMLLHLYVNLISVKYSVRLNPSCGMQVLIICNCLVVVSRGDNHSLTFSFPHIHKCYSRFQCYIFYLSTERHATVCTAITKSLREL